MKKMIIFHLNVRTSYSQTSEENISLMNFQVILQIKRNSFGKMNELTNHQTENSDGEMQEPLQLCSSNKMWCMYSSQIKKYSLRLYSPPKALTRKTILMTRRKNQNMEMNKTLHIILPWSACTINLMLRLHYHVQM